MKLENSTSSLDTQMAKENAIKQIVTSGKESLNQLGSWISANAAKATLFSALTFTAPAAFSQTPDVVKNDIKTGEIYKPITTDTLKNTVKIGDEPIKDSAEYKKEREALLKEWERVQEELQQAEDNKARSELLGEQVEMLTGPINFFNKVQEQGGVFTERDGKFARAGIAIVDKTNRLPQIIGLSVKVRKILVYISSQSPQQVITKN